MFDDAIMKLAIKYINKKEKDANASLSQLQLFNSYAAKEACAFSTKNVNAALSYTAMSASILRSISIEAFLRPLMNLL